MARAPFSINLVGTTASTADWYSGTSTSTTTDAVHSEETAVGTSRRKPKGWIPPTGYSLTIRKYRRDVGRNKTSLSKNNWSDKVGVIGGTGGRFNSLNNWNSTCNETTASAPLSSSAALVRARNKMKDSKVNLGVAFAERNRTASMVGDTAKRLARAVQDMRRGNFRDAYRRLGISYNDSSGPKGRNWVNAWLQSQYGWKPLLSDIYGSVAALSKRPRSDFRVTSTAHRGDTTHYMWEIDPNNWSSHSGDYGYRCEAERKRGVFVRIDAVPDNDLTMSLSSLGVTNPLEVAWELVPYSFVVDWFLPVGDWLSSMDAMLGYSSAYTSTTTYNQCMWESWGISRTWSQYNYVLSDFQGYKEGLWIRRTAQSGVPFPRPPSLKDPRSLGHMANGLSLLAQAFGRR